MLSKAEVDARLKAVGAFYLIDIDDLHEVWGTAWGFHIWVPIAGPYSALPEDVMLAIEFDILSSKP